MLETSDFLKDDCLKINCTVGVVVSAIDCSRLHSFRSQILILEHILVCCLENMEGSDVVFDVAGEKFHAHKLVLAARSPVFRNEFFDRLEEDTQEVVITDLEPKVFKQTSMVCKTQRMCESHICKDISVHTVAKTLALADRYHATELKAVCLRFAAENLAAEPSLFACFWHLGMVKLGSTVLGLSAVMRSEGFNYLKENFPALQSEILKTVAGCEEDCSSGGGKTRSVWAQLSDGGDTNGRREGFDAVSKEIRPVSFLRVEFC
ncbi:BTB/POZ and MATH domain-containing protein 4 [Vitis vinifera]|uniref:BTB/POZ and MATH domain-containing protein 4 n=1 Tax=Vitis vinifera TaxID=29760 RepID=A0A438HB87_VITVI|nr:BTB/POZ and MATH domain-containing protein 4 [Vitis vinifera]